LQSSASIVTSHHLKLEAAPSRHRPPPGLSLGAIVRVPEMPGVEFRGTVSRVASELQPGTRTLLTEIDVPNRGGLLTPGTYCEVELQIPRKTMSLIVPAEAVIFSRNGLSVAIVEDGTVHLRELTVARDHGTTLEVSAGVKDGDQVILNPSGDISEGRVVRSDGGSAERVRSIAEFIVGAQQGLRN
jgi:multidrug efflux pump subunit AcrA (membrane-fusion protein)